MASSNFEEWQKLLNEPSAEDLENWKKKLLGKQFVENNEVLPANISQDQIIRESDLPEPHLVVRSRGVYLEDYISNRLNIVLDENNNITDVRYG
jgi:hypothetical protein